MADEGGDRFAEAGFVQRPQDLSRRGDALRHFESQMPGHERRIAARLEVEQMGPGVAADLQDVPESFGRDQARFRTLAFDQRVGGDRGAVHEVAGGGEVDTQSPHGLFDHPHDSDALIARRRRLLEVLEISLVIEKHQVGKRSPDVDADAQPPCFVRIPVNHGLSVP